MVHHLKLLSLWPSPVSLSADSIQRGCQWRSHWLCCLMQWGLTLSQLNRVQKCVHPREAGHILLRPSGITAYCIAAMQQYGTYHKQTQHSMEGFCLSWYTYAFHQLFFLAITVRYSVKHLTVWIHSLFTYVTNGPVELLQTDSMLLVGFISVTVLVFSALLASTTARMEGALPSPHIPSSIPSPSVS